MDVDASLRIRANKCLDLFQEVAFAHSEDVGASFDWLNSKNLGWVITIWKMQVMDLPRSGQQISLKTSTGPLGRIQAARQFWARDEEGQDLFVAQSLWVLMNKETRKPSRLPKDLMAKYGDDKTAPILTRDDFKEPELRPAELFKQRKIATTRRDMDSNRHINNVAYVTWAMDDITDEIYESKLKGLDVRYHTEAKPGMNILAATYISESKGEDGKKNWQVTTRFLDMDAPVCQTWPSEEDSKVPYFAKVSSFWSE